MNVEPLVPERRPVRPEPLCTENLDDLCSAGPEEWIWKFSLTRISNRALMSKYIETALAEPERGISLPFITVLARDGLVVGSTRFGNIDILNRKVEIGWTWITPAFQRTFVNTEDKLLILNHAFEKWKCVRVQNRRMGSAITECDHKDRSKKKREFCGIIWSRNQEGFGTAYFSVSL